MKAAYKILGIKSIMSIPKKYDFTSLMPKEWDTPRQLTISEKIIEGLKGTDYLQNYAELEWYRMVDGASYANTYVQGTATVTTSPMWYTVGFGDTTYS